MTTVALRLYDWFLGERRRTELDRLDKCEVARIAGDVGVSTGELNELMRLGPDAAALLSHRMRAIGLNPEIVGASEPATMRDMQRLCSQCGKHGRCERDLNRDPQDPTWRSYCPNSATLLALQ